MCVMKIIKYWKFNRLFKEYENVWGRRKLFFLQNNENPTDKNWRHWQYMNHSRGSQCYNIFLHNHVCSNWQIARESKHVNEENCAF